MTMAERSKAPKGFGLRKIENFFSLKNKDKKNLKKEHNRLVE